MFSRNILYFFKVTILLELRYRSPLEGNEDSDDGLDDEDDEEFIPNVGLVSLTLNKLLFSFLQKIFKSEKTINFCQDLVNGHMSTMSTMSISI